MSFVMITIRINIIRIKLDIIIWISLDIIRIKNG